ncbi:MAG TPA: hypothetical protein VFP93_00330, partial [Gammaproteobacteria bacterium]|nr:hypothetical protein [Gammaproteobacteria bacterium]
MKNKTGSNENKQTGANDEANELDTLLSKLEEDRRSSANKKKTVKKNLTKAKSKVALDELNKLMEDFEVKQKSHTKEKSTDEKWNEIEASQKNLLEELEAINLEIEDNSLNITQTPEEKKQEKAKNSEIDALDAKQYINSLLNNTRIFTQDERYDHRALMRTKAFDEIFKKLKHDGANLALLINFLVQDKKQNSGLEGELANFIIELLRADMQKTLDSGNLNQTSFEYFFSDKDIDEAQLFTNFPNYNKQFEDVLKQRSDNLQNKLATKQDQFQVEIKERLNQEAIEKQAPTSEANPEENSINILDELLDELTENNPKINPDESVKDNKPQAATEDKNSAPLTENSLVSEMAQEEYSFESLIKPAEDIVKEEAIENTKSKMPTFLKDNVKEELFKSLNAKDFKGLYNNLILHKENLESLTNSMVADRENNP